MIQVKQMPQVVKALILMPTIYINNVLEIINPVGNYIFMILQTFNIVHIGGNAITLVLIFIILMRM